MQSLTTKQLRSDYIMAKSLIEALTESTEIIDTKEKAKVFKRICDINGKTKKQQFTYFLVLECGRILDDNIENDDLLKKFYEKHQHEVLIYE